MLRQLCRNYDSAGRDEGFLRDSARRSGVYIDVRNPNVTDVGICTDMNQPVS